LKERERETDRERDREEEEREKNKKTFFLQPSKFKSEIDESHSLNNTQI
jgi:hypothetical protein